MPFLRHHSAISELKIKAWHYCCVATGSNIVCVILNAWSSHWASTELGGVCVWLQDFDVRAISLRLH